MTSVTSSDMQTELASRTNRLQTTVITANETQPAKAKLYMYIHTWRPGCP